MDKNTIDKYIDHIDELILKGITIDLATGEFYEKVDDDLLLQCLTSIYQNPAVWDKRGVIRGTS